MSKRGWIGVDLDGTLAHYDRWRGASHIGAPIGPMVERVKAMLATGSDVRIFTARVACTGDELAEVIAAIDAWCLEHFDRTLPVTNVKDFGMVACFDDRAKQVVPNTGVTLEEIIASVDDGRTANLLGLTP